MALQPLTDDEADDIRSLLRTLKTEHRDLDQALTCLDESLATDELVVRRMKKRKLLLKDRILQLEQMLVPDIPA